MLCISTMEWPSWSAHTHCLTTPKSPVAVAYVLSISLVLCTPVSVVYVTHLGSGPCPVASLVDDSPSAPAPSPSTALPLPETLDSAELGDRPPQCAVCGPSPFTPFPLMSICLPFSGPVLPASLLGPWFGLKPQPPSPGSLQQAPYLPSLGTQGLSPSASTISLLQRG